MASIDLSELEFDNIHNWPRVVQVVAVIFACALLIGLVYFIDFKSNLRTLKSTEQQEKTLKSQFEHEQKIAANLKAYEAQYAELKKRFVKMLRFLPNRNEVPGLLEDISKKGVNSGLQFRLFDPMAEQDHGFYKELPIAIEVIGDYQQLGSFISEVAGLPRIVTIHNIEINDVAQALPDMKSKKGSGLLLMRVTAKTYRYITFMNE